MKVTYGPHGIECYIDPEDGRPILRLVGLGVGQVRSGATTVEGEYEAAFVAFNVRAAQR